MYTIDNLVNLIINKKFKTSYLRFGEVKENILKNDLEDISKEFKNIFTDFVINEFYKTSLQSDSMVKLIFENFNQAILLYIDKKKLNKNDIIFIYKGGNVLRTVAYESMHELPGFISNNIKNYYKDYFKKSDNDFSIIINPNLENFDEIYDDMKNLAYLIQNYLRNSYILNQTKYFDYYRLNNLEKTKILSNYIDKLNSTNIVQNKLHNYNGKFIGIVFGKNNYFSEESTIKNKIFNKIKDKETWFIDENQRTKKEKKSLTSDLVNLIELSTINEPVTTNYDPNIYIEGPEFYISSNDSLSFSINNSNISFALIRTKILVNLYFQNLDGTIKIINSSGELIDVSIPNKYDSSIKNFYNNINKFITVYTFPIENNNVNFKSYTLEYLTHDLEYILFDQTDTPWEQNKYQKRIKRLLYMYFILLIINRKYNLEQKIQYISFFSKLINNLIKSNNKEITNYINEFINKTDDNSKKFPYRNMFVSLNKILKIVNINKDELLEYLKLLQENFNLQINILNDIDKYKKSPVIFTEKMIENLAQLG